MTMWIKNSTKQKLAFVTILALVSIGCIFLYLILNPGAYPLREAQHRYFQKQFAEAIPYYKKAIEAGSTSPFAYLHLADSYTAVGNFNAAVEWYKIYLKNDPQNRTVHLALARALNWAKRYDEAEEEYKELLKENNNAQ